MRDASVGFSALRSVQWVALKKWRLCYEGFRDERVEFKRLGEVLIMLGLTESARFRNLVFEFFNIIQSRFTTFFLTNSPAHSRWFLY